MKQLKADIDAAQKKQDELQNALANAKDEATRKALETQLAQAKADTDAKKAAGGSSRPSGGSRPSGERPHKSSSSNCAPGDPMCGDL
jgi:hypothetical protein